MRDLARGALGRALVAGLADLIVAVPELAHERGVGVVEDVERFGHADLSDW